MKSIQSASVRIAAVAGAALLMGGLWSPAFANTVTTTTTSAAAAAAAAAERDDQAGSRDRVCVRGYSSGSLLRRTLCQSRAEWARDGGIPTS